MDFRRRAAQALGQAALFACGIGVVIAAHFGLYACIAVLLLLAVWLGSVTVWPTYEAGAPTARAPTDPATPSKAEQRWLGSLLDQTPAPLLALHPDGVIRTGNRAARTLFRTDDRLVQTPDALVAALNSPSPTERLTVTLDTEGGPRAFAVSMSDLVGPEGALRLAVLLDIQPEIRAAEAAALRDLLQVLSHEIMNALTPIASLAGTAVDLLGDETPASTAHARDAVGTLARRAEGLTRFVDAYRTLARLPPPSLKPTRLGALLGEVARVFRSRWERQGVVLEVSEPALDFDLDLDMDLLVHALMNVMSNGAEATLAAPGERRLVRLTARARESGAVLTIEDSGPGVMPADRERVFRPFFTTKTEGTGVGLSFARQVALSHGGDLTLLPQRAGIGAEFILTI
jgi:two-component system, NtrC family, nitrogen regulation sensor histidine kinase NtrY